MDITVFEFFHVRRQYFFYQSAAASDSQQAMWAHILKTGGVLVLALSLIVLNKTYRN